jgi:hypothetical protein
MEDVERAKAWFAAAGEDAPVRDEDVADEYDALLREIGEEAAREGADAEILLPSVPTRAKTAVRCAVGEDEATAGRATLEPA